MFEKLNAQFCPRYHEMDLNKYFDLSQPGRYTVRLIVPPEETNESRPLSSNQLVIEIPIPK